MFFTYIIDVGEVINKKSKDNFDWFPQQQPGELSFTPKFNGTELNWMMKI